MERSCYGTALGRRATGKRVKIRVACRESIALRARSWGEKLGSPIAYSIPVTSGYRLEIERMQAEVLDYVLRPISAEREAHLP